MIYLDNNATTAMDPEVLDAMTPFLTEQYGNPSSLHSFGVNSRKAIENARAQVADFIGAGRSEILFTSGATESINTALHCALLSQPKKTKLVISEVEHPAVSVFCEDLTRFDYRIKKIGVHLSGELKSDDLESAIDSNTAIVSLIQANNETGVIFPVEAYARLIKDKGSLFHVDAVQALGRVAIDVKQMQCDFLSGSGHKLHGPKGVGFLYVKKGLAFEPLISGGGQEMGRRGGTENVASIVGLGKACELAKARLCKMLDIEALRNRLEEQLLVGSERARINGVSARRIANTSNISFKGLEGESLVIQLGEEGICVSTGSACSSGAREPSRVLRAMGIRPEWTHGAIRFSLSHTTTAEEIDHTCKKVLELISRTKSSRV